MQESTVFNPKPDPELKRQQAAKYPLALPLGTILNGRFLVQRVLGQGGFGITYLAWDLVDQIPVAVKEYMPQSLANRTAGAVQMTLYQGDLLDQYDKGMRDFLREAQVLAAFNGDPHIVGARRFFEENGTAYLVMEYVQGQSFKQYIKDRGGKIPWEDALRVMLPVMDALSLVHSKGILHRDVAPDNIYLTPEGGVKLLDFGAARSAMGNRNQSMTVMLKAGYTPLEQYTRNGKQGPYSDVYATAATIYGAITGYLPPDAVDRVVEDHLVPISALQISIPEQLEQALSVGLAVTPDRRYQTMAQFRQALGGLMPEQAQAAGENTWLCSCGTLNTDRFCSHCGAPKPHDPGETGAEQTEPVSETPQTEPVQPEPEIPQTEPVQPEPEAPQTEPLRQVSELQKTMPLQPEPEIPQTEPVFEKPEHPDEAERAEKIRQARETLIEKRKLQAQEQEKKEKARLAREALIEKRKLQAQEQAQEQARKEQEQKEEQARQAEAEKLAREQAAREEAERWSQQRMEAERVQNRKQEEAREIEQQEKKWLRLLVAVGLILALLLAIAGGHLSAGHKEKEPEPPASSQEKDPEGPEKQENVSDEVRELMLKAKEGDAEAQFRLACAFDQGDGVPLNYDGAVLWAFEAASQGHSGAEARIGLYYLNGLVMQKNTEAAYIWFEKAAYHGDPVGQYNLGLCYLYGRGTEENKPEAVKWLQKSADQDYMDAITKLGDCYYYGWGVRRDYAKAVELYTKASDMGSAEAQYQLGYCYRYGHGAEINNAKAVDFYRLSAEQGFPKAQARLGECLFYGWADVPTDQAKGVSWFQKAADQGDSDGMLGMGRALLWGEGIEQDIELAIEYLEAAGAQNNSEAYFVLGDAFQHGRCGTPVDLEKARDYYQASADLGYGWAQEALDKMEQ